MANHSAQAQQPDVNALVAPLARKISQSHKHKIAVLPLICSDEGNRSLGVWLARQLSASLASNVPGLELIDASAVRIPFKAGVSPEHPVYDPKTVQEFAEKARAEILVSGNFGAFGQGVGVSLWASKTGDKAILAESNGRLDLTPDMKALLSRPLGLDLPSDGVYQAGWGGVSLPKCLKCPDPRFPENERSSGRWGRVVLLAVVGADGLAHRVEVQEGTSANFAQAAVDAVKGWKFKSALGPDGQPVAVRVPIEVTFRQ